MNSSYYLLGPMGSSDDVFLVANSGKIPYFLTFTSDNQLIFDPRVGTPIQLNLSSNTHGVVLSFVGQNQSLSYIGTSNSNSETIASPSSDSVSLIQTSPDVNLWSDFLAGVHYTFHDAGGSLVSWQAYVPDMSSVRNGVPTQIMNNNDGTPMIQFFRSVIRVIPTKWFEEGSCAETSGSQSVIQAEVLWVTENGQVPNGYTTLGDCQVGVRYSYCGKNVECNKSCRGPCTRTGVICSFESDINGFRCTDPPTPEAPIYRRPWFIGLVVILSIVIVLVFFLFLFRFR